MRLLSDIARNLWLAARNVLPLIAILVAFQTLVLRRPIPHIRTVSLGIVFVVLGLFFFLSGVSMSLLPLGNELGRSLVTLDSKWLIMLLAFAVGYASTLVEPGLQSLAGEVEEVSVGTIRHSVLIHTVAAGVGTGMSLGVYKILNRIPTQRVVIPMVLASIVLMLLTPEEFVGIAFDCASATTGPVNIPINMAIAIGLSQVVRRADPLLNGFGVVGLTSLGPVLTVMLLGIVRGR